METTTDLAPVALYIKTCTSTPSRKTKTRLRTMAQASRNGPITLDSHITAYRLQLSCFRILWGWDRLSRLTSFELAYSSFNCVVRYQQMGAVSHQHDSSKYRDC
jgi:hypothetical protein